MKKVSRNIAMGEPITNPMDLLRLANEGRSVVWEHGFHNKWHTVRPAAFFVNWPLAMLAGARLYYSVKIEKK